MGEPRKVTREVRWEVTMVQLGPDHSQGWDAEVVAVVDDPDDPSKPMVLGNFVVKKVMRPQELADRLPGEMQKFLDSLPGKLLPEVSH